jgi:hypothetical protein
LSRQYANPLQLDIQVSYYLKFYILLVFTLLTLAICNYPVSWEFRILLITVLAIFLSVRFLKQAISCRLIWAENNHWTVEQNGQQVIAALKANSFISVVLSVLNFKDEAGRSFSVLLFPDSINAEQFRQLRVRLKVENPVHKKTC